MIELDYHVVYIFGAIAFGSKFISWMNDSGFWIVCKLSGFSENETLKTWSLLLGSIAIFGLVEIMLLATVFPLK